jgi:anti-sigma factor (TIGR02949 family)
VDKEDMQIDCTEVRRELSNYIENDVTPDLRRQMEEHFAACPGCTAVYDGLRNVIQLVSGSKILELPTGFSQRLLARLAAQSTN